ncbi:hypothetical protein HY003_00145 [Candidatus Saccharibacteria bacterium]|nr:hypothetical protein [Candidatus Saccharibacteria bacterium]MBI3337701.1 hypothetical protein [Candidatus Saccharibacteria bacterium]
MAKSDRKTIEKVFILLGSAVTVVLIGAGGLAWYGYHFATTNVRNELSAQKIYFPAKGDPALDPIKFPDLQQYAGQQVNDGPKAKAYANGFIGRHLAVIADGKTYAEISAEAMKNPTNQKLQAQKQALFQGETLRGILLGDGYAYWTFGMIAKYAAFASFAGAVIMGSLVLLGVRHLTSLK